MKEHVYFDIETGPLPEELLAKVMPEFEPPGNIKDPAKIQAALAEKRARWTGDAALRSTTGQILAVTIAVGDKLPEFLSGDERSLVVKVVDMLANYAVNSHLIYTWNGSGFDLPFICQRATVYDVAAFPMLTTRFKGRYSWHESFVDAMQVFTMQYQRAEGFSLDVVAKSLGVGQKNGKGKDFAETLRTDPDKAKEYAVNDVELLRRIVIKMGI